MDYGRRRNIYVNGKENENLFIYEYESCLIYKTRRKRKRKIGQEKWQIEEKCHT